MPDVITVHVPRPLNNFSLFYRNPAYIADVFSPVVEVTKESDKYYVFGKEHFNLSSPMRADKARTAELTYSLSLDTYYCDEYGYHELISDRERGNADEVLNMDLDTTEHLVEALMVDKEFRLANSLLNASNSEWGAFSSTHFTNLLYAWADQTNANPRNDIYTAKKMIFKDARRTANKIAIPVDVCFALAQVDNLDELRKYTDPNLLTNSGIPMKFFGLDVSEAQSGYNAALDGVTEDMQATWGANVLIAFVNPSPMSRKSLTFALTFRSRPFRIRKWREEDRESDVIEATHCFDNKIVAPACGFVLLNAIS